MLSLKNKNIVIAISGGIAAYKSLSLIRLFKKSDCEVKVVTTKNALEFVTQLTIETLSQNKLYYNTFDCPSERQIDHIALSDWADCVILAPATANIIGKYANGIADDVLSSFLLAVQKPLFIAPAMNNKMYENPAVQENIHKLKARGCHLIDPVDGFLACGTEANGRMEEPEKIYEFVARFFASLAKFSGKKVLVSAGPTYEPIDPVRFVGNYSSGLMGFALANAFSAEGAEVTLVAGPTHLLVNNKSIHRVDVICASEMYDACLAAAETADIIIMAAAVADYKPKTPVPEKIKKKDANLTLELIKTVDILATLGTRKRKEQFVAGFALETENELDNAIAKLHNKNLDLIVLNSLKNPDAGFKTTTNQVTMITRDGDIIKGELKDKNEVAKDIVNLIYYRINQHN
jgi:phosphopantothenoylcysteine decarboxylase / phosphopantothenate---cysteine ligase